MKTTIYFSALLALIIQVMVKDQTPVAQVISNNTIGSLSNTKSNNLNSNDPDVKKFYPVLNQSNNKSQSVNRTYAVNSAGSNSTDVVIQQSNIEGSASNSSVNFTELQQQAKDLNAKSLKLRLAAKNSEGLVKTELNYEANELYKLYEQIQIEGQVQDPKDRLHDDQTLEPVSKRNGAPESPLCSKFFHQI